MLKEDTFICIMDADSDGSLKHHIMEAQNQYADTLNRDLIQKHYKRFHNTDLAHSSTSIWKSKDGKLVIPSDNNIHHKIMRIWHNLPTAGCPRRDKTIRKITHKYHWPSTKHWIADYVKGCTTCQQNKNLTHRAHTPCTGFQSPLMPNHSHTLQWN